MAALQESGGNPQALRTALERVITETPGTEEREKMVADASQALEAAFRSLIPIVSKVAEVFSKFIGGDAGVKIGGAVAGTAGALWAAKRLAGSGAGAVAEGAKGIGGAAAKGGRLGPIGAAIAAAGYILAPTPAGETPEEMAALKSGGGRIPSGAPSGTGAAFGVSPEQSKRIEAINKLPDEFTEGAQALQDEIMGKMARGEKLPDYNTTMEAFMRGDYNKKKIPLSAQGGGGGDMNVSFDPVVITIKNESGEVLQSASTVPRADTRSGVSE